MPPLPLKTAIVGLGRIGWTFHLRQAAAHPGFAVTAVVEPLAERRAEAAAAYGVPAGYADTAALYARGRPDLVVVASPTHLHRAQVLEAFAHGCDVFCDKPLALTLADTDAILEAMRRHGRKLMVYQPHRITPEALAARWILDSGLLGRVYLVKRAIARFDRRTDWQAFRRYGGGMLNNYGAHFIDQFLHLNRAPFRAVSCTLRALVTRGDADDMVKAVLTAENGVLLDLDINMAAAHDLPPWYLAGTRGAAVYDPAAGAWMLRHLAAEPPDTPPQDGLAAARRAYGSGETLAWQTRTVRADAFPVPVFYDYCHAYFARGEPPFVPVAETREVMRAIALCRESAEWPDAPALAPEAPAAAPRVREPR